MKNCPMKELCYERFSNGTCDNCAIDKTINKKDKEIARLNAENAELRARLEKAVELPLVQTIRGNKLPYEVAYKDNNGRIIVTKYRRWQKKQAEARLKELKEGSND